MQIKLENVRLSFPELFTAKSVNGSEAKFAASFLLEKKQDADQIKTVREAIEAVANEKWASGIPKGVKKCLHEGAEKDYDGYTADNMYLSATSKKRPTVVDFDRSPLTADDGRPYGGCYVNAVVRLWAQDNQFGKRINAELQGVQFAKHGQAFGAAPFNPEDHFAKLDRPADAPATSAAEDDDEILF